VRDDFPKREVPGDGRRAVALGNAADVHVHGRRAVRGVQLQNLPAEHQRMHPREPGAVHERRVPAARRGVPDQR
jgi:hypothetical protein